MQLKPSEMFFDWLKITKEIMRGEHGLGLMIFFWCISPLLPACVLGWYIGDFIGKFISES